MNLKKYLKEWAIIYLKNKDIIKQDILEIEDSDPILIRRKSTTQTVYIEPKFKDQNLNIKQQGTVTIVTLNLEENILEIVKRWQQLIKIGPLFNIILANPITNTQFSFYPQTHNNIIEPESLEKGLIALHENNDPLISGFEKNIKQQ
jgi:hypothetical protein